jgi:hypothetical protein
MPAEALSHQRFRESSELPQIEAIDGEIDILKSFRGNEANDTRRVEIAHFDAR